MIANNDAAPPRTQARAPGGGMMLACAAMSTAAAVTRWLAEQGTFMEERTALLVEENSFTEHVEGGRRVAALVRDLFAIPGLSAREVKSDVFADHLVFESAGRAGAAPIALVGHYDTVFPPGTFEGFRVDGDLVRGPGVLDMKGGLVVVATALRALAENVGLDAIPPVRLVIVADEEVGSPEGKAIIEACTRGSASALVFEAGRANDAIITMRKGTGGLKVTARGKAAHAGADHRSGANALWALARFVDLVQKLTDYERGVTVNVGRIVGGQGKNTVPDEATADVDLRFVTQRDAEQLVSAVHEAARAASAGVPGTHLEIHGGIARAPLEKTPASEALLRAYGACAAAAGLGNAEAALIGGGSDASTTSALGIASIDGLGPRGKGFHTKDEQVERSSFVPKATALAQFLLSS